MGLTGGETVKKGQDNICVRDMMLMLGVGLLSPMIRVLPRQTVTEADATGWMAALVALPVLLLIIGCMYWAIERLPGEKGLGELFTCGFGHVVGRAVCGVYFLWALFSLSVALRLYGERLMTTAYRGTSLFLFLLALLALELWISHGKLDAFARMARIFSYVLANTLVLVMVFSLPNVEVRNLLPIWFDDAPGAVRSALPALANMGTGVFLFFLSGRVTRREKKPQETMWWTAGFCVLLSMLSAIIIGSFGAKLVMRMQVPFFSLAKGIRISGAMDRVESIVVAVWVLTDVVFIGLLIRIACTAGRVAFRLESGQRLATPILFAAFPSAFLVAENTFALNRVSDGILEVGNLILAYGVPLAACAAAKLRKRI